MKKALVYLLALSVVLLVVGCGNSVPLYDDYGNKTARTVEKKRVPIDKIRIARIPGTSERFVAHNDANGNIDGFVRLDDLDLPREKRAPITYRVSAGVVTKEVNGRTYEIENARLIGSNTGEYRYFSYDDNNPYKWDWEVSGIYFFDVSGVLRFCFPVGLSGEVVSFSLGDHYLVELEYGGIGEGKLTIYSFPKFVQLAHISYSGGVDWYGDYYLFYTTRAEYESSNGHPATSQIHAVDFRTQTDSVVMQDESRGYNLLGVVDDRLSVGVSTWINDKDTSSVELVSVPEGIRARKE